MEDQARGSKNCRAEKEVVVVADGMGEDVAAARSSDSLSWDRGR